MRINILSDLHLDFWFNPGKMIKDKRIYNLFQNWLDPDPEVEALIVAGDITHYNSQIYIVERIAELYNYKKYFLC
jgi:predicted phosphodiesterase